MIDKAESLVIQGMTIDSAQDAELLEGIQVLTSEGDNDTAGVLRNVRTDGKELIGDIHLREDHELTPLLLERWEKDPEHLGIESHTSGRFTFGIFYNRVRSI